MMALYKKLAARYLLVLINSRSLRLYTLLATKSPSTKLILKSLQTLVAVTSLIATALLLATSALAEPAREKIPSEENSVRTIEISSPSQVSWEVSSNSDIMVSVTDVALSKVIPVKPGFTLVWLNEGYTATDMGPYNRLFLVCHSDSEMPHYQATFFLGNVHSVTSVRSIDKQMIQIEALFHSKLSSGRVRMIVDLADVNASIKAPPQREGQLNVSVKITISEIL